MFDDFTGLGTIITEGETVGLVAGGGISSCSSATGSGTSSILFDWETMVDLWRKQRISELVDSQRSDTSSAESIHLLPLSWIKKVSTLTTAVACR